jgi:hypothetical protein
MLTRYASVLQVREITAVHGTAVGSGAGREAPGRTSHYSREAAFGRRASWNVVKPRIQCVLTHWMSGFRASGGMNPAFLAL